MKSFVKPNKISVPSGYVVEGTTMTIPNLAPSLLELIAASATDGLPMVGQPLFDESESAGEARLQAKQCDLASVFDFGMNDPANEEGPSIAPRSEPENETPTENN